MKRVSYLLCSFLLFSPGMGSGQGICFVGESQRKSWYPFSDNSLPAKVFQYKNPENHTRRIKSAEVRVPSGDIKFSVHLDRQGRILSQYSTAMNPKYAIRTDSVFGEKAIIVVRKVYDPSGMVSIDSSTITNHEFNDGNVHIRFCRKASAGYKYGRYINLRNQGYNAVYYNLPPKMYKRSRFLPVELPPEYAPMYNPCKPMDQPWKKKYNEDQLYLCSKQVEITEVTAVKIKDGGRLSYKQLIKHPYMKEYGKGMPIRYYVEGEAFVPPVCVELILWGEAKPFTKTTYSKNEYGLNEALYEDAYPRETGKVSVKPQDPDCEFFLQGRSGIPERKEQYLFRYEYYEE